jgi:hypothetical protein
MAESVLKKGSDPLRIPRGLTPFSARSEWTIERLSKEHDRAAFSCGQPTLDGLLRTLVSQYEKRRLGRTFVATEPGQERVAGYYTLAAGSFDASCLPAALRRGRRRKSLLLP